MTGMAGGGNVLPMTKRPGAPIPREATTPSEYKAALAARIRARREELDMSQRDVSAELSAALGRSISADTYRKWETIDSIVQVDAILPLCDILGINVFELLAYRPGSAVKMRPSAPRAKAVA